MNLGRFTNVRSGNVVTRRVTVASLQARKTQGGRKLALGEVCPEVVNGGATEVTILIKRFMSHFTVNSPVPGLDVGRIFAFLTIFKDSDED